MRTVLIYSFLHFFIAFFNIYCYNYTRKWKVGFFLAKIKINYTLKSSNGVIEKEIIGIKRDHNIIFKDDGFLTNIEILNDGIVMIRDNDETTLNLSLGKTNKCTYFLKNYNKEMNINIHLIDKMVTNNTLYFKYETDVQILEFKFRFEVI